MLPRGGLTCFPIKDKALFSRKLNILQIKLRHTLQENVVHIFP